MGLVLGGVLLAAGFDGIVNEKADPEGDDQAEQFIGEHAEEDEDPKPRNVAFGTGVHGLLL
jgi:hypothetical protein